MGFNTSLEPFLSFDIATPVLATILLSVIFALLKIRPSTTSSTDEATPQNEKPSATSPAIEPLHSFNWRTARRLRPRNFRPIYHISMGIRSDTPSQLITIDEDYADRIAHRRHIMATYPDIVLGSTPAGKAPVQELYEHLSGYLPVRYPTVFKLCDDKLENLATGGSIPTVAPESPEAALRILGETVEEELFLLLPTPEGHRSVAFLCCFPSGFDPSEKLDKLLFEIHGPVPGYDKIGPSMERFFAKLEPGKPVKRSNWSVQTSPELFDCKHNPAAQHHNVDMRKVYFRSELQTLSRLPKTRAILFSFKTYLENISDIKEEGRGAEFADAIEGLTKGNTPEMWNYKGAPRWADDVVEYLRA